LGIFKIEVLVGVGNANHPYIPLKGESGFRGFSGFSGLGCWWVSEMLISFAFYK
jgi:hypothetical protein